LGNEHLKALYGVIVEAFVSGESILLRRGRLGQINVSSHGGLASRLRQSNNITGGKKAPIPLLDFGWQPVELGNIGVLQSILFDLIFFCSFFLLVNFFWLLGVGLPKREPLTQNSAFPLINYPQ
jgi:hypothetical protein